MKAKQRTFTLIELIAVVVVIGTLAVTILPSIGRGRPGKPHHATCKSNLKNIGTTVAAYFADGEQTLFTVKKNSLVKAGDMEMDPHLTMCPIEGKNNYVWLTGPVEYSGSATKAMATDSVAHKKGPKFYAVYEDGHVSSYEKE